MPEVSILIAARNEEANILDCLRAIDGLAYPADAYEVLVGNDQSSDRTGALVEAFIRDKPHYQLFLIEKRVGHQAGKANVLAQLAHHARGRFLLFTDADCAVSPTWLAGMLQPFRDERVGVVTGCTQLIGQNAFERLQAVDWFYGQYLINGFASLRIPITAMGNNMAVRRSAYDAVGGYDGLPFSLVEDYQLFTEIVRKNYTFAHRFLPDVLATTQPLPNLRAWLQQRKRWTVGALQLPVYFTIPLLLQTIYYPFLLVLAFWSPGWAAAIWGIKFGVQSAQVLGILNRFRRWDLLSAVVGYEFYLHIGYLITLVYYLLPTPVLWKGRRY